VSEALIYVDSSISFCEVELNLLSASISALMAINLAVDELCCKDENLLNAVDAIKFIIETLGKKIQK
jgi:hypothetical protein